VTEEIQNRIRIEFPWMVRDVPAGRVQVFMERDVPGLPRVWAGATYKEGWGKSRGRFMPVLSDSPVRFIHQGKGQFKRRMETGEVTHPSGLEHVCISGGVISRL
jgi:hypothetical protein